ncbi:MAG: hypothetical protein ACRC68_10085, partial [Clostridium sp.]
MKRSKRRKKSSITKYLENISKKDSVILFATIIVIVFTIFLKTILLPQINEYNDKKNEISYLKDQEMKIELANKENIILESTISELKETYSSVSSKLSKTPKVAQVIYDIEKLIKNNKLNLVQINLLDSEYVEEEKDSEKIERGIKTKEETESNIKREDSVKYQSLNIQVVGAYKSILGFIKAIENYERICEVVNVSIS